MPPTTCSGHCQAIQGYQWLLGRGGPGTRGRARPSYLDLHKVNGLHKPGLGSQHAGVEAAPGRGDDLAAPAVDGISVQRHIVDVEAHSPHVLLT